jgi:hypothetical protein
MLVRTSYAKIAGTFALFLTCACSAEGGSTLLSEDEVIVSGAYLTTSATALATGAASPQEKARMAAYLRNRVPPEDVKAVIKIENRRFDCIEPHKQFSLRGLARSASDVPRHPGGWNTENDKAAKPPAPLDVRVPVPDVSCPQGTVPIRKFEIDELSRYPTLEAWLNRRGNPQDMGGGAPNEYAARRQYVANIGFQAMLNVWNPVVQTGQGEFSLMQLWLLVAHSAARPAPARADRPSRPVG